MLSERPLGEVLDEVAARTPAPGGGSAAAWSCALGAGLVAMAASFAPAVGTAPGPMALVHAEAERLRAAALELAEGELVSYAPVLAALRLARDDPARPARLRAALADASAAPLEIARVGSAVAELAVEVATDGSAHLRGDALAGALLAEAGCRAAACLVELNLRDAPAGDRRLADLAGLVARATAARDRALAG